MLPPTTRRRGPAWLAPVAVGAAAVGALVLITQGSAEQQAALWPGCLFRQLTGLDCPGCGGTRAVQALARGDAAAAMSHNALTMLLAPTLVWIWARWLAWSAGIAPRRPETSLRRSQLLLVAICGFWVLRNVPVWPLSWLASGG